ncbi:hypothetical protein DPPLL_35080 [Desulfofustis limnaeus]|uniref:AMP-binding enzyme C-terminal domain-containing protein n=1 Tax=Desulfofustis limnaeus TaxID=2740163 RepID=A0ABN6MC45_9BACT|nr:hypothetical protein DPPLL_35080 [Desulfofustis limnaeus]
MIPPEYFIHLVGVVLNDGWIEKFQVLQYSFDLIIVKIVCQLSEFEPTIRYKSQLEKLAEKIKLVMGKECKVSYEFVEEIPVNASGKYFYTISQVDRPNA